jgi:RNA polymerase-binding transcription factor DksA
MSLDEQQRTQLRVHVAAELERTAARAGALRRDFDDIVTSSAEAVRDDEHDPEGATIAFERAQVAALLAGAEAHLAALEQTAARLEQPDAGRCERCGGMIGFERLLARPTATRCVRCAR